MNRLAYLTAAMALVWAGAALYLVRLSVLRRSLEARLKNMENRMALPRVEP